MQDQPENQSDVATLLDDGEAVAPDDDAVARLIRSRKRITREVDGIVIDIQAEPTAAFLSAAGEVERIAAVAKKLFPSDTAARDTYPPLVAAMSRYLAAVTDAAPELAANVGAEIAVHVLKELWGLGKAAESSDSSTSSPTS